MCYCYQYILILSEIVTNTFFYCVILRSIHDLIDWHCDQCILIFCDIEINTFLYFVTLWSIHSHILWHWDQYILIISDIMWHCYQYILILIDIVTKKNHLPPIWYILIMCDIVTNAFLFCVTLWPPHSYIVWKCENLMNVKLFSG